MGPLARRLPVRQAGEEPRIGQHGTEWSVRVDVERRNAARWCEHSGRTTLAGYLTRRARGDPATVWWPAGVTHRRKCLMRSPTPSPYDEGADNRVAKGQPRLVRRV